MVITLDITTNCSCRHFKESLHAYFRSINRGVVMLKLALVALSFTVSVPAVVINRLVEGCRRDTTQYYCIMPANFSFHWLLYLFFYVVRGIMVSMTWQEAFPLKGKYKPFFLITTMTVLLGMGIYTIYIGVGSMHREVRVLCEYLVWYAMVPLFFWLNHRQSQTKYVTRPVSSKIREIWVPGSVCIAGIVGAALVEGVFVKRSSYLAYLILLAFVFLAFVLLRLVDSSSMARNRWYVSMLVMTTLLIPLSLSRGLMALFEAIEPLGNDSFYFFLVVFGFQLSMGIFTVYAYKIATRAIKSNASVFVFALQVYDDVYTSMVLLAVQPLRGLFFAIILISMVRDIVRDSGLWREVIRLIKYGKFVSPEMSEMEMRWRLAEQNLLTESLGVFLVPFIIGIDAIFNTSSFGAPSITAGFTSDGLGGALISFIILGVAQAIAHIVTKFILKKVIRGVHVRSISTCDLHYVNIDTSTTRHVFTPLSHIPRPETRTVYVSEPIWNEGTGQLQIWQRNWWYIGLVVAYCSWSAVNGVTLFRRTIV